jgi:hypothetical protein
MHLTSLLSLSVWTSYLSKTPCSRVTSCQDIYGHDPAPPTHTRLPPPPHTPQHTYIHTHTTRIPEQEGSQHVVQSLHQLPRHLLACLHSTYPPPHTPYTQVMAALYTHTHTIFAPEQEGSQHAVQSLHQLPRHLLACLHSTSERVAEPVLELWAVQHSTGQRHTPGLVGLLGYPVSVGVG